MGARDPDISALPPRGGGALALTQKSAAKPILQELGRDLAREKEMAQRIDPALRYLEQNLPNVL